MASLATEIEKKLGIKPILETGDIGQLDVYAGDELLATQSGLDHLVDRLTGPNNDALIAAIAERMKPA